MFSRHFGRLNGLHISSRILFLIFISTSRQRDDEKIYSQREDERIFKRTDRFRTTRTTLTAADEYQKNDQHEVEAKREKLKIFFISFFLLSRKKENYRRRVIYVLCRYSQPHLTIPWQVLQTLVSFNDPRQRSEFLFNCQPCHRYFPRLFCWLKNVDYSA